MKKLELKAIADSLGMDFIRHPITREASGVYLVSDAPVPVLDEIVNLDTPSSVCGECIHACPGDRYTYRIFAPTAWFDLWGWA